MRKRVTLAFDSLIASSKLHDINETPLKIVVEHGSQEYSYLLDKIKNNRESQLGINVELPQNKDISSQFVYVSVLQGDNVLIKERINLDKNYIGALKMEKDATISLVFRVINSHKNEICIFGVPKFHISEFKINKMVNNGCLGTVYEVVDSLSRKHVFKVFGSRLNIENPKDIVIREIIPFIALPRHPCMIKLDGFIYSSNHFLKLVLEIAERGRINEIDIRNLNDGIVSKVFYGLFSCIAFLHEHGFVHRDIHPSNILITKDYEVRLIDFSVSRFIGENMSSNIGHRGYVAPESYDSENYDELVDEYQLGTIIRALGFPARWFIDSLTNEDTSNRITCSEMCTIIENELIGCKNTEESMLYFEKLSKYHESRPIRDNILWELALFYVEIKNDFTFLDLIKLANNCGIPGAEACYNEIIRNYDGLAFDIEYNQLVIDEKIDRFLKSDEYFNFTLILRKMKKHELIIFFSELLLDIIRRKISPKNLIDIFWTISNNENNPDIFYALLKAAFKYYKTFQIFSFEVLEYAATLGSIDACDFLAYLYATMWPNYMDRLEYYSEIALENGRKKCAMFLGLIAEYHGNRDKAIQYFKISAKYDSFSMYQLAIYYFNVTKDKEKGIKYMKKSANEGYPMAQYCLAVFYFWGYIVQKSYSTAFWYNSFALNSGITDGLFIHGMCLFFGLVDKVDYVNARVIFEKSIKYEKNPNVLLCLSTIYTLGLGVDVNFEKANYYTQLYYDDTSGRDYFLGNIEYIPPIDSYSIKEGSSYRIVSREEHILNVIPKVKHLILDQSIVF